MPKIAGIKVYSENVFLKKYKKIKELQKSGNSVVYLYQNIVTNELFAVKKITINNKKKNKTRKSIINEIKMQNKVKNDNILYVKEIYFNKKELIFSLIYEYSEHGDFVDFMINNEIDDELCKNLIKQIVTVILQLHNVNITHCDIKPDNFIIFKKDGKIKLKLTDFGFSHEDVKKSGYGTKAYRPPEQCSKTPISSIKGDIWSMGILFFCTLTKKLPVGRCNATKNIMEYETNKELIKNKHALDLFSKMLIINPEDRISCNEILLHKYLE